MIVINSSRASWRNPVSTRAAPGKLENRKMQTVRGQLTTLPYAPVTRSRPKDHATVTFPAHSLEWATCEDYQDVRFPKYSWLAGGSGPGDPLVAKTGGRAPICLNPQAAGGFGAATAFKNPPRCPEVSPPGVRIAPLAAGATGSGAVPRRPAGPDSSTGASGTGSP